MLWSRSQERIRRSTDRHLAATVRVRLEHHRDIEICEPSVRVKAGVVLLQGRVCTLNQKGLASIVTARVHGVRGVFNLLRVEQPGLQSGGAEPNVSGTDHAKRHTGLGS